MKFWKEVLLMVLVLFVACAGPGPEDSIGEQEKKLMRMALKTQRIMKKLTKLDNQLLAGLREKHPDATFSISSDDPDSPSIEFEEKKDADLSDEEREAIRKDVRKTEREFSTDPEKKKILKKRKRMIKKQKRIVMKQAININGNKEEEKEKGGQDSRESKEEKQQKENGQEGEEE